MNFPMVMKLLISLRLFLHLLPRLIIVFCIASLVLIYLIDVGKFRLPLESSHSVEINAMWINLLYSIFGSSVFYVIAFGIYDYRKATSSAPFIIAKVRRFVSYAKGNLSTICQANGIPYEMNAPVEMSTYISVATIDPRTLSNVSLNGQQLTWNQYLRIENEKVQQLCSECIDSINNLNFPDHKLLELLFYLKESPHFGHIESQANWPSNFQLDSLGPYVPYFEHFIRHVYQLENFLQKFYPQHSINIDRTFIKNEKLEKIIKNTHIQG